MLENSIRSASKSSRTSRRTGRALGLVEPLSRGWPRRSVRTAISLSQSSAGVRRATSSCGSRSRLGTNAGARRREFRRTTSSLSKSSSGLASSAARTPASSLSMIGGFDGLAGCQRLEDRRAQRLGLRERLPMPRRVVPAGEGPLQVIDGPADRFGVDLLERGDLLLGPAAAAAGWPVRHAPPRWGRFRLPAVRNGTDDWQPQRADVRHRSFALEPDPMPARGYLQPALLFPLG